MKKSTAVASVLLSVLLLLNSICVNGISITELKKDDVLALPDVVKETVPDTASFTARLKDKEEDLNTFVFQNADGTETMITYDYPVKYVDDGHIKDVTLDLKQERDGYIRSLQHPAEILFSDSLNDGISVNYSGVAVSLYPEQKSKSKKIYENKIIYFCDDDINYVYSLTYTGFKEEIVLNHPIEKDSFSFLVRTNGLSMAEKDGNIILNNKKGEPLVNFGDILVYSVNHEFCTNGEATYDELIPDELYRLSVTADKMIFENESLYPLVIDPDVELLNLTDSGAIEDLTINSDDQIPAGTSGSIFVGKRQTYGKSRILMKFPNLNLSAISRSSNIVDAKVYLRDLMCESSSMTVYCYRFTGNDWSENNSSSCWNNVSPNSYYSEELDSKTISYSNGVGNSPSHYYGFNITAAVQIWKQYSAQKNKGLLFKASDSVEDSSTYLSKTFASYNRSSNKPYIVITYTVQDNVHFDKYGSRVYLYEMDSVLVNLDHMFSSNILYEYFPFDGNEISVQNASIPQTGFCNVTGKKLGVYYVFCHLITHNYIIDTFGIPLHVTLRDDAYYFRNYESERHLSVLNNTLTEGNTLCQWTFNQTSQLWYIYYNRLSDTSGYYTIKKNNGNIPYYIGLNNSNSVIITSDIITNDYRWKIRCVEDDEGFVISPYTDNSKALAVSTSGWSGTNGAAIELNTYVSDYNYSDEWVICSKKSVSMVDGHDDYPITSEYTVMQNSLANIGITNVFKSSSYSEHAVNRDEAIDRMRYSKAVFVNGHGSQMVVNMHNTYINSSKIGLILNDDGGAFDMCDLVVYVSCLTAKGGIGANNLCQATLDAGVNTVIGFSMSIPMTGDRYWMKKFTEHLCDNFGDQTKSYSSIVSAAMSDTAKKYPDLMDYYYEGEHVVMNSCVIFGTNVLPSSNAWN